MLINSQDLLRQAQLSGYAIGAFNTYNLEITLGIIQAGESTRSPLIIQIGEKALDYGRRLPLAQTVLSAAKIAEVPVAVHLDHARSYEIIQTCLDWGFTSVMYDGSALPFEENLRNTVEAVKLAHNVNVPLEAELGAVSGDEDKASYQSEKHSYTDPELAENFVNETKADSLAVAIGNAHGYYVGDPELDFRRLEEIRRRVDIPLVLHGASGIPDHDIQKAIQKGICKINVNTDLRFAYFKALEQSLAIANESYNLISLMSDPIKAVQKTVEEKIKLFGSAGRV